MKIDSIVGLIEELLPIVSKLSFSVMQLVAGYDGISEADKAVLINKIKEAQGKIPEWK